LKEYTLYAGVNGAGKSTLYQADGNLDLPRINMDEIVREFGSWKNPADVFKAGKIAARSLKEYLEHGISFNQETTLCGNSVIKHIHQAKDLGYIIKVYYVGVSSVEIAKERVRYRVANGGHGIPEEDIERRYQESFEKFLQVIPLCDSLHIYDNTEFFREVALMKKGTWIKIVPECPEWCRKLRKHL